MSNMQIDLNLFEALTEAGVKPETARRVEKRTESAFQNGLDAVRAELSTEVFTKADGARLEGQMKSDTARMEGQMKALEGQLKAGLADVKADLQRWFFITMITIIGAAATLTTILKH